MYQIERRKTDRFIIPGAKVLYYTPNGSSNLVSLTDISINSIRFELTTDLKILDMLDFELIIPSKEKILLKGNITGLMINDPEYPDSAVIQFEPFGSDDRYNSIHSYNQLKELIKEKQDLLVNGE